MSATLSGNRMSRSSNRRGSNHGLCYALNVRMIAWTAVVFAVCLPAVYLWHAYQIQRGAKLLLARVETQESAHDWHEAAMNLHRYLRLRPGDVTASARLAKAYDSGATSLREKSRAIQLYTDAIALSPENVELLRGQTRLVLETGDYTLALARADELLKRQPRDPVGLRVKALGMLARWRFNGEGSAEQLVEAHKLALSKTPEDAVLASELARLYRSERIEGLDESRRRTLAGETMQQLIDASTNKPDALLARYHFRTEFGLEGADADLDAALEADGEHENYFVRLASASRAYRKRDWQAAEDLFQDVINVRPGEPTGYLGLGAAREELGDEAGALSAWQLGLKRANPNDLSLQFRVVSAQIRSGQFDDAEQRLSKLQKEVDRLLGQKKAEWQASLASVRSNLALGQKDYRAAIDALSELLRLRRADLKSPGVAAVLSQAERQLGACHAALLQWDEAASAYQRAAQLQPNATAPRFEAAAAWEAAGRLDEAVRQYENGLAIEHAAQPLIALAHARFRQQLFLPQEKRDWRDFSETLAKAQEKSPGSTPLKLLDAEFEIVEGRRELALATLRGIESDALSNPDLTRRLVFAYERCQRPDEADRVMGLLRDEGSATLATLLLAAELHSSRGKAGSAIELVEQGLGNLSTDDQIRGQNKLALLEVAAGQPKRAIDRLQKLVAGKRADLECFSLLAELSLDGADAKIMSSRGTGRPADSERAGAEELAVVKTCADAIQEIEGRDGSLWRFYRAQRLLRETATETARARAEKLLNQATNLADEVQRRRPNWALAYVLRARIHQSSLRPDSNAAIKAYFQALRLGENRLRIYEELVALLYQENRIVEAAAQLERLQAAGSMTPVLTNIAMFVDARQGNLTRAIETARRDVERRPNDAMAHLRLGQLLAQAVSGRSGESIADAPEAESEFRRATDLAPDNTRVWLARFAFCVQAKQLEAAAALLKEIEQREVIAEKTMPFVLAQAYSLLQQTEKAAEFYRQAVMEAPDDLAVQVQAAKFFFKTDPAQADACLNRARELAPDDHSVTRLLVTLKANQSMTEEELENNLALLDGKEAGGAADTDDQRLQAFLLVKRGGTQWRQRAEKLLETLISDSGDPAPIDRLLLARLYEARGEGGVTAARVQLEALVNREKPRPDHLAIYVDHLLRNDQASKATAALDQLAETEPEANYFRTLSLRVRWLAAMGRVNDIESLVDAYTKAKVSTLAPAEQAAALREVAELYSRVDLLAGSEATFRRAMEMDAASFAPFAIWLVRHDRTSEAIEVCSRAAETEFGRRAAMTLCTVVALGHPSVQERRAAESLVETALQAHPKDALLLLGAATMRLMAGETDKAITLLRQVLKISPGNLQALNNLAMLLADRPGDVEEALNCVDRAIAQKGLDPELLDTKGWILLQQKRPQEAADLFREAVAMPPGDPRHQFHLALAYRDQGKFKEARQTLARAHDNNLASAKLSPDEQSVLAELEAALK